MSSIDQRSRLRLNRALAVGAGILCFLAACSLGCARTGRAIGGLIESVGSDFTMLVNKIAPEEAADAN